MTKEEEGGRSPPEMGLRRRLLRVGAAPTTYGSAYRSRGTTGVARRQPKQVLVKKNRVRKKKTCEYEYSTGADAGENSAIATRKQKLPDKRRYSNGSVGPMARIPRPWSRPRAKKGGGREGRVWSVDDDANPWAARALGMHAP